VAGRLRFKEHHAPQGARRTPGGRGSSPRSSREITVSGVKAASGVSALDWSAVAAARITNNTEDTIDRAIKKQQGRPGWGACIEVPLQKATAPLRRCHYH